jgi:hypothetical protein
MAEATVPVVADPQRTVEVAGRAFIEHLQVRGRTKSHIETVESHLRVHLVPFFGDRPIDRIEPDDVTRLLARLRAAAVSRRPRNIFSTLYSVLDLAVRRRWVAANPCKQVEPPEVPANTDIGFLSQAELSAVLEGGVRRPFSASSSVRCI